MGSTDQQQIIDQRQEHQQQIANQQQQQQRQVSIFVINFEN
jgi:hypothetical protein